MHLLVYSVAMYVAAYKAQQETTLLVYLACIHGGIAYRVRFAMRTLKFHLSSLVPAFDCPKYAYTAG